MDNPRHLTIKKSSVSKGSVIYVMSRDQRTEDNHALLAAQALAKEQNTPLYVLFVLKKMRNRSREHYEFMIEGLKEVASSLSHYGIGFILRSGNPTGQIIQFAQEVDAGSLVFDFSPLIGAQSLDKEVAKDFEGSITVVDTHNIIPAWVASEKQEFAAHTMRRKIHQKLEQFLIAPELLQKQSPPKRVVDSLSFEEANQFIQSIPRCGISVGIEAGQKAAQNHLRTFTDNHLEDYAQNKNDISKDYQSGLSPYLHFGHISSLRVVLNIMDSVKELPLLLQEPKLATHGEQPNRTDGMNVFLEEIIVRKELSDNFCLYSDGYSSLKAAPQWAQKSLAEHAHDRRDFIYNTQQWESAATHDDIWNAAQTELTKTGKMHGYMRMYWAKKMLEWSVTPEEALKTAVYLNDKYSIDGGDPNGYVGILWSIAGLHDRPWFERMIFGKIRYMNEAGLRRKFLVDQYIERVHKNDFSKRHKT